MSFNNLLWFVGMLLVIHLGESPIIYFKTLSIFVIVSVTGCKSEFDIIDIIFGIPQTGSLVC